ncbi:MAG TPA: antibiotic biosynthesis monooxygenase [Bryobacteraceae bacterium]|jgi:heme-degrading monooxygenase HmoA|nr:antibiotic biosynthesis monooxygenase [Bryobacteraceae bacterium]
MLVILFRSKLADTAGDEYRQMATELDAHARTFDGFVDVKAYLAEDGERLTVVWWRDEESLAVWRNDVRHRFAQQQGRARWYEYYKMDVATVVRQKEFSVQRAPASLST